MLVNPKLSPVAAQDVQKDVLEQILLKAYKKLKYVHYLQVLLLFLTAVSCTCAGQQLSQAFYHDSSTMDCMLFANWTFEVEEDGEVVLLDRNALIGKDSEAKEKAPCSMIMFAFVTHGCLALIFGWLFVVCRPRLNEILTGQSTKVFDLIPLTIVIFAFVLAYSLYGAILFLEGFNHWCAMISRNNVMKTCADSVRIKTLRNGHIEPMEPVYAYLNWAKVMMWIGVCLWSVNVAILFLRIINKWDRPAAKAISRQDLGSPRPGTSRDAATVKQSAAVQTRSRNDSDT